MSSKYNNRNSLTAMAKRSNRRSDVRKFLEDVSVWVNGCWQWIGEFNKEFHGYGCFYHNSKRQLAHRYMWELMNDTTVPAGMVVMHICDNTACVRPDHLKLGTQRENIYDMISKDRANSVGPPRIVTSDLIKEARRLKRQGLRNVEIGVQLGLGESTIGHMLCPNSRYLARPQRLRKTHNKALYDQLEMDQLAEAQ